jgi:ERCC4-type nuclease
LTKQVVCDFHVVIDTREQQPYEFRGIIADAKAKRAEMIVPTVRKALNSGDYSIVGLENRVAVERKSKEDFYNTIGQGRERFIRELERLNQFDSAIVVVEAPWTRKGILTPPKYSRLSTRVVTGSVLTWQHRYRGVHWNFVQDRNLAEVMTFRLLEKFWREWETRK